MAPGLAADLAFAFGLALPYRPDHAVQLLTGTRRMSQSDTAAAALGRLLDIMAKLRDPVSGCPWDREQTFATIAPYTIEEAYEVADAIARDDCGGAARRAGRSAVPGRLPRPHGRGGGPFDFADVARGIADKMVRRHPHVFGDAAARDAAAQTAAWEVQKQAERAAKAERGTLAGIAAGLPALTRAAKLTARAGRVGFDWPDAAAVLDKLAEETAELRAELPAADPARLADEVGDMLFVMANLARKLDLDPEDCLRRANAKFARRFGFIEDQLASAGKVPADASLAEMEALWTAAKQKERR